MVVSRRKELLRRRRRIEDEGEEEEDSVAAGLEDDSLSEESAISDADDDADGEGSDGSETAASDRKDVQEKNLRQRNGTGDPPITGPEPSKEPSASSIKPSLHTVMRDTQAMMNGLRFSGEVDEGEEINFEDLGTNTDAVPQPDELSADTGKKAKSIIFGEDRRREHEEYRKKRDADPAFVPNRGGFFMHDHRSGAPGQNGFRPFGRGRGRGRGIATGPFSPAVQTTQSSGPSDAPWSHDLHDTVAESNRTGPTKAQEETLSSQQQQIKPSHPRAQPPNRSFSTSLRTGNVQIRVYLAGMPSPVAVSAVPVYRHTRLPHHRPPLRRDKPVRISIPEMQIRYIFPSADRSFIFIPRALRPNQQGFGRIRGRGSFSGGYGGFSSRRTSAYAGSTYSPSVPLSRRSSLAREVSADTVLLSPQGPLLSQQGIAIPEASKPVVRLPPAAEQPQAAEAEASTDPNTAPTVNLPQPAAYPPPQDPTFRENRPAPLPMHQPRPQKTVSVADIESPAFNPPQQQQQQPFHQQMPLQVSSQQYQPEAPLYPHSRHPSHPSQASAGTPLSQIPERVIHAQPFQPYPFQPAPAFYPQQYPPPPLYYYPSADLNQHLQHPATAPAFVPGQPYIYPAPVPIASQPPPPPVAGEPTSQAGTVAHESNGMVYYYDSSQMTANAETNSTYPTAGYSLPPASGMVGITAPVPYFPQPSATPFYPPQ